ncbi:hypothetical protein ACFFRR_007142 [Megaselia abdita]
MPFVQRVLEPTFLSRSQKTTRFCNFVDDNFVVLTKTTSASNRPEINGREGEIVSVNKKISENGDSVAKESGKNSKIPSSSSSISNNSPASSSSDNVVETTTTKKRTAKTSDVNSGITTTGSTSLCVVAEETEKSSTKNENRNTTKVITGFELESMCNITLSNSLRQLASLLVIANNMFSVLNTELQGITERTTAVKKKLEKLEGNVYKFDPKLVSVPEGDLSSIAQLKNFYESSKIETKELFTKESRPNVVKMLYEEAAKGVTYNFDCSDIKNTSSDQNEESSNKSMDLICTPVFGKKNRQMQERIDADIEIRMPEGINNLRKWTSSEALGDVTVTPDCVNRIESSITISSMLNSDDEVLNPQNSYATGNDIVDNPNIDSIINIDVPLTHRLPSPEEQCKIIALKYPAELISVDISGKRFERMCNLRRSINVCIPTTIGEKNNLNSAVQTVTRRSRSKKTRGKRRNTIAGIDQKEIQNAMGFEESKKNVHNKSDSSCASTEFEKHKSSLTRLGSLKQWSCNRLKLIMRNNEPERSQIPIPPNLTLKKSNVLEGAIEPINEIALNMNVSVANKKEVPFYPKQGILPGCVKLRDSSMLSRYHEKEEPHSSSGNWSASSESGRTSIASEITLQAKSSATSNSSLNASNYPPSSSSYAASSAASRRRFLNMSASDSITTTTDGTATPDIPHSVRNDRILDDETSSAYSCDTEGYYTSFHIDSGLKTLKEEQSVYTSFNTSIDAIFHGNSPANSIENEYELFGRGSTSTTTSSATTIITNLQVHENSRQPSLDEDNLPMERSYSSSTLGSNSENANTIKRRVKANDMKEFSESSDVEGHAATLRIKEKTSISSNRIPSICLITPTTSDDERHVPRKEVDEDIYDDPAGVYVTISKPSEQALYYSCNNPEENIEDLEYVSLKELPSLRMNKEYTGDNNNVNMGVRIKRNPDGKIVYESDSIKRNNKSKMKASSFAPGTHVKETESALFSESNLVGIGGCVDRRTSSAAAASSSSTSSSQSTQKPVVVNMTSKSGIAKGKNDDELCNVFVTPVKNSKLIRNNSYRIANMSSEKFVKQSLLSSKSMDRLGREFSLCKSLDSAENSTYLQNKSLENFDANEEYIDVLEDLNFNDSLKCHSYKPHLKVVSFGEENLNLLPFLRNDSTDIW